MISNDPIDDDEWMNIPPIVRRTLAQLEEDSHAARKLTEALRIEHKQVNELVRHLIDKQTGFEIDAARQQLLLQPTATSPDVMKSIDELKATVSKQRRNIKDIQAALDSDHKVQEKLNTLVGEFVDRQDADIDRSRAAVDEVRKQISDQAADIDTRLTQVNTDRAALQAELAELAITASSTQEHVESLRELVAALTNKTNDSADGARELRSAVKNLQDSHRSTCDQNEQRFNSFLRMLDKSHAVSEGQFESVKSDLLKFRLHVSTEMEDQVKVMNKTSADLHAKMMHVQENCADAVLDIRDRLSVFETDSKSKQENVRQLSAVSEQLRSQVGACETQMSSLVRRVDQFFAARDQRASEDICDRSRADKMQLSINRLDADTGRLRDDVNTVRRGVAEFDSTSANVAVLKSELDGLKQSQTEMRVNMTQMLEMMQQLSGAVERLENQCASPQLLSRPSQLTDDDPVIQKVVALLSNERETRETDFTKLAHTMTEIQKTTHHLSVQMQSIERTNGELMSLSRLNGSLHDEYSSALKDIRPALVELETVKRRIAALEAQKSSAMYDQASRDASPWHGLKCNHEELSTAVNDLKRREVDMLRAVHRLEQQVSVLASPAAVPTPPPKTAPVDDDAQGVVAQLSADITHTLEKALAAETASASFRSTTDKRLRDCEDACSNTATQMQSCIQDVATVRQEIDRVQNEQQQISAKISASSRPDRLVTSLSATVTTLKQQVTQQATRLGQLESELAAHMDAPKHTEALLVENAIAEYAPLSSLQTVEVRLASLEAQSKGSHASCTRLINTATAKMDATTKSMEARVEALLTAVAEAEQKSQRASGLVTRRLSESSALITGLQKSHTQLEERISKAEEQLADASASPSSQAPVDDRAPSSELVSQEVLDAFVQRLETSIADLCARVGEVEEGQRRVTAVQDDAVPKGAAPPPGTTAATSREEEKGDADVGAKALPYYPRDELEERLENMWTSIVSLLARKDDQESVNKKLDGLHRLVGDEVQVHLRRLERDVDNALSEKVSLAELQDILESSTQM